MFRDISIRCCFLVLLVCHVGIFLLYTKGNTEELIVLTGNVRDNNMDKRYHVLVFFKL